MYAQLDTIREKTKMVNPAQVFLINSRNRYQIFSINTETDTRQKKSVIQVERHFPALNPFAASLTHPDVQISFDQFP